MLTWLLLVVTISTFALPISSGTDNWAFVVLIYASWSSFAFSPNSILLVSTLNFPFICPLSIIELELPNTFPSTFPSILIEGDA